MEPSEFWGTPDAMVAEAWLMQLEKIFDVVSYTKAQKVSFAIFTLKGETEHWWRTTRGTLPIQDGELLVWDRFEQAFQNNYFPLSVREAKEAKFMSLIQGNRIVLQ